jgi:flagellar biosynthesis protein FlhF
VPIERFRGGSPSALLADARAALGPDAVVLAVRRERAGGLELVAADAASGAVRDPSAPRFAGFAPGAPRAGEGPLAVALVGPTGAGKTTTLAKLAHHPRVFGGRTVGFLCLDTYRVGAAEQLSGYAALSRVPCEVVWEARELGRALHRLRRCEVVLVDTAGRGPRQGHDAEATWSMLRHVEPREVHVVLPAGLRPDLARRLAAEHRERGATHLLVTKLDECPGNDDVLALARGSRLPMRWTTNGQSVPGDLADAAELSRPGGARAPRHLVFEDAVA